MANPGWWDLHRLMRRNSRGPDVVALQKKLNEEVGAELTLHGLFDLKTEEAVKEFQRLNDLHEDGVVGPLTYCTLFLSNYRFEVTRPRIVRQARWTCWAAATESALASNWSPPRKRLTVADLLAAYRPHLAAKGDITIRGFDKMVKDLKAFQKIVAGKELRIEGILRELGTHGSPIILVHDLTGSVAHTEVIFGVSIKSGDFFLLTMDPLAGVYHELDVLKLRARTSDLRLVSAHAL